MPNDRLRRCSHCNVSTEQQKVPSPTVTEELEPLHHFALCDQTSAWEFEQELSGQQDEKLPSSGLPRFALNCFTSFPLVQSHTHCGLACTSQELRRRSYWPTPRCPNCGKAACVAPQWWASVSRLATESLSSMGHCPLVDHVCCVLQHPTADLGWILTCLETAESRPTSWTADVHGCVI